MMWIHSKNRCRRAFTLIELLVVIAIIAILAALLVPATQEALDRARSIACQSNLHQDAIALTQYADDHDGVMPAYWDNDTHSTAGPVIHWQFTIGVDYLGEPEGTFYRPDMIRRSSLHCPSDQAISIPRYGGKPVRSVAINGTMNPRLIKFSGRSWPQTSGATLARLALVKRPSDMCMGGDGAGADFTNEWGSAARYYDLRGKVFQYIRHMGGLNVFLMDGHVMWHSKDNFERIISTQGFDGPFFDWGGKNQ